MELMSLLQPVIPEGYKQTEVGVIPLDWELVRFGDLVNYIKGYPFKSSEYTDSGIRVVRVSDTSFTTIKNDNPIYISEKSKSKYKKWMLVTGNIIFTTVGSKPPMYDSLVGKAILAKEEHSGFLLNQNAVLIKPKLEAVNISNLLINHFRTERYIDHIEIIYRGNANQASITLEGLFEFQIPLPSSPREQTAIANALSDVDALLSELEKLIAKKQAIKTATMQQLLTGKTRLPAFAYNNEADENQPLPEGAKQGQRKYSSGTNVNVEDCDDGALSNSGSGVMDSRRKGTKPSELGEIPEDWEAVKLPEVVWYQEGPGLRNWQFTQKGLKVINVTNLQESGNLNLGKTDRHITWEECEKTYKHFLCDAGDLVIASSGNSYCKSSIVREVDLPLLMNTSVIRFKAKADIEQLYMTVYLRSKFFKDQIDLMITGGAQPNFGPFHLNKVLIPIPSSKEEQTAIANILSDMDTEIQTLEQRLSKTRQIKQGMMQELLTGKTRLPFNVE
jgi:restriction endonuclease S subunit